MDSKTEEELKQSFQQLQAQRLQTQQSVKQVEAFIRTQEKKLKKLSIIRSEVLCPIPKSNIFLGIGRMFIQTSESSVCRVLDESAKLAANTVEQLKTQKSTIEDSLKKAEDGIREKIRLIRQTSAS
uniref:Prefoldin subunit 1 n=1 Tax=Trichuris muris TaxID=70415 RepID=A0A5S6R437_TRIMR